MLTKTQSATTNDLSVLFFLSKTKNNNKKHRTYDLFVSFFRWLFFSIESEPLFILTIFRDKVTNIDLTHPSDLTSRTIFSVSYVKPRTIAPVVEDPHGGNTLLIENREPRLRIRTRTLAMASGRAKNY